MGDILSRTCVKYLDFRGVYMKKGFLGSIVMALWFVASPSMAQTPVDTVNWLEGEYVGVGAIDMHKLAQRRIYTYLMNFFVTDSAARQAFQEIRDAGITLEETLQRIVVGVPNDVEHSEHIIFWETSEDLTKYKPILVEHAQKIDVRKHLDVEYYATKRSNECLVIVGNVLALGSELRIKEIIASHKAKYNKGPQSAGLKAELKRVDRKKDAWFVFAIGDKERAVLKRTDPIIDMTQGGLGAFLASEMQSGNLVFDFSAGLNVQTAIEMIDEESAERSAKILTVAVKNAAMDVDIRELGFDAFMSGIEFKANRDDLKLSVVYDQTKFDSLIAFVTQFAKSITSEVGVGQSADPQPIGAQPVAPAASGAAKP